MDVLQMSHKSKDSSVLTSGVILFRTILGSFIFELGTGVSCFPNILSFLFSGTGAILAWTGEESRKEKNSYQWT